jgi:hypothetical protein
MTVEYYPDESFLEFVSVSDSVRNPYASGYGRKIPTRFRVRTDDGRIRRVYVMQFANAGSAYVWINGRTVFLRDYRFPSAES